MTQAEDYGVAFLVFALAIVGAYATGCHDGKERAAQTHAKDSVSVVLKIEHDTVRADSARERADSIKWAQHQLSDSALRDSLELALARPIATVGAIVPLVLAVLHADSVQYAGCKLVEQDCSEQVAGLRSELALVRDSAKLAAPLPAPRLGFTALGLYDLADLSPVLRAGASVRLFAQLSATGTADYEVRPKTGAPAGNVRAGVTWTFR